MCGIIGIASNKLVSTNIVESLKRLEYRGYDSAGLATLHNNQIQEKNVPVEWKNWNKFYLKIPLLDL
jgi:glucosamine--fructose-6-phosphate aminotransferase (isomerizing)